MHRVYLIGFLLLLSGYTCAEGPKKKKSLNKAGIFNFWKIELNAGATSYFGDLSEYDLNPVFKVAKESVPGIGLRVTKSLFHDKIGVGGQLIKGGFRCYNDPDYSFRTGIFEYNIQAHANITRILVPDPQSRLSLSAYVGAGQFLFWTYAVNEPAELDGKSVYRPGVPEFVYFFGGILNYKINDVYSINLDLSTRQAQNDYLDLYRYGHNFDYYSYLAVGVSVFIDDFQKRFKKKQECDAYDSLHR